MLNLVRLLAVRELQAGWRLYLALALLIITAAALIALAPIFRVAMADLALERQLAAQPDFTAELRIDRHRQPATAADFRETRDLFAAEVAAELESWSGASEGAVVTGLAPLRFAGGDLTAMQAYFQLFRGLGEHVRRVEGGAPGDDPGAVAVSQQAADELGIHAGDDLVFLAPEADEPIRLHVAGVLTPAPDSDAYFLGSGRWFDVLPAGLMDSGGPIVGLFIDEAAYLRDIAPLVGDFRVSHLTRVDLQAEDLNGDDVAGARAELETTIRALNATEAVVARSPLVDALRRYESQERFNTTSTFVITVQFAGVALFAVVLLGREAARRTREDRRRLRVRGASARQMVAAQAVVGLLVSAPAVGLAAPVAAFALAQAGRLGALEELTGGAALDTRLTPIAWGLGVLGAVLSWAAFTSSGWLESRASVVEEQARVGRPVRRALLHRYYLDVAVLLVGGLLFFQFRSEAEGGQLSALQRGDFDVLLLAGPGLLLLGVALVLLRLVPLALAWGARAAAAVRAPAWLLLAFMQLARNPGRALSLLALVLFVSAVGALAASYEETIRTTAEERIRYEAGADLRAVGVTASADAERAVAPLEGRSGVDAAGAAYRSIGGLGGVTSGSRAVLLAVQTERFAELVSFRDDYAAAGPPELLARLEAEPGAPGLTLPAGADELSVWVRTDPPDPGLWVEARVVDGAGRIATVRLGAPSGRGWTRVGAALRARGAAFTEPVQLVALTLRNAAPTVRFPAGTAWFDDLAVTTNGQATVIEAFDAPGRWFAGSGAGAGGDQAGIVASPARDDDPVSAYQWTSLRAGEERQLVPVSPNIPVPAAMDRASLAAAGLTHGDVVAVALPDFTVPVRVVAEMDLFPTLDPHDGAMVVVDLTALQRASAAFSSRPVAVTELWANTSDADAHAAASAFLRGRYVPSVLIDAEALLAADRSDPFGPAGAGAVFVVGLVGLVVVGVAATLILFASVAADREREGAILSAIGYGPLATLGQATVEAGLVLAVGAGLGLFLGRQVASSMLAFLDVTAAGEEAIPPFLLATDWPVAAVGITALLGAGLLGVLLLAQLDRRAPAGATLRNAGV